MNQSPEKRSTPRTALRQTVCFERTALDHGSPACEQVHGVGRDICSGGASFTTDCPLHRGEILRLHISLGSDRASVPVISEVRWTGSTQNGFRVGVRFLA